MEDNFHCAICMELADDAVETSCCHYVFCEGCLNRTGSNSCPTCREQMAFSPCHLARRIIGGMETECAHNCGITLARSDRKTHEQTCPNKTYTCPAASCNFVDKRDSFLEHITSLHGREMLLHCGRLFEDEFAKSISTNDRIKSKVNERGDTARLGENGKYFCQQRLNGSCRCCNGSCGPTNGCNCGACMKLDVRSRLLPKQWLVNTDGAACRKGETGKYYCGRRNMTRDRRTDGYCGPTNGNNCQSCEKIDTQCTTRYGNVWS